jgi:hypothetical protein
VVRCDSAPRCAGGARLSSLLSSAHRQDLTLFLIPLYPDQAPQRGDVIADDFARWGSCGVPSIWRSPTTRQPGGSPRPNRCVRRLALPPGCRVVALGEVDGMPHPAHPGSAAAVLVAGHPGDLPARRGRLVGRAGALAGAAFADVARLGGL